RSALVAGLLNRIEKSTCEADCGQSVDVSLRHASCVHSRYCLVAETRKRQEASVLARQRRIGPLSWGSKRRFEQLHPPQDLRPSANHSVRDDPFEVLACRRAQTRLHGTEVRNPSLPSLTPLVGT